MMFNNFERNEDFFLGKHYEIKIFPFYILIRLEKIMIILTLYGHLCLIVISYINCNLILSKGKGLQNRKRMK